MKRRIITSASNNDVHPGFGELENAAYNVGYDMTVSDKNDITLIPTKDGKYMPTIVVETEEQDGVFYYSPTLTFPTLKFTGDDFSDTIHYWISKWEEVGRFITQLCDFKFDPSSYEE